LFELVEVKRIPLIPDLGPLAVDGTTDLEFVLSYPFLDPNLPATLADTINTM
jgi:hypothetical protein